jgi:hypothetical protein
MVAGRQGADIRERTDIMKRRRRSVRKDGSRGNSVVHASSLIRCGAHDWAQGARRCVHGAGAGSGPRPQTRRLNPAGFSFPFVGRGKLLIRPFKPMLSGYWRWGKSGGPPPLERSFNVKRDSTHSQNSRFAVAPGLEGLNARGPLKVRPKWRLEGYHRSPALRLPSSSAPSFCGCWRRFRGSRGRLPLSTRKGLLKGVKFTAQRCNLVG